MSKTGITTDCVCDLPKDYLKAHGVDLVYFYITTDTGRFRDGYEITSENILEYLRMGGGKAETRGPEPKEYQAFFESALEKYDELIHIAISGQIGVSCQNAMRALELMEEKGKRVTVIDSRNLSTGIGHLVMKAVELRDEGRSAAEIAEAVMGMRGKLSTTFITWSAESLYRNGQVSKAVERLSTLFPLHPVLVVKNGRITLKSFRVGNYEKCVMRYVRSALGRGGKIDGKRLFITHAGGAVKMTAQIRAEAEKLCKFGEVIVTQASATVSGNCGPGTVGVLFIYQ